MSLRTHYDNLKVARNAPLEVIRAAYRVLAQRYHPDLNRTPDAARIMALINEAYEVLRDPLRRAEHDAWIDDQLSRDAVDEASAGNGAQNADREESPPAPASSRPAAPPLPPAPTSLRRSQDWFVASGCLLLVGALVALSKAYIPSYPNSAPVQPPSHNAPNDGVTLSGQMEGLAQQARTVSPPRSYSELAKLVNATLLSDGLLGVVALLKSCHTEPAVDGHECVALDAAGRLLFETGIREFGRDKVPSVILEYFEEPAQERRIAALESAQRGTRETLTRYYEASRQALPKLLHEDLTAQIKSAKKSDCLVHDPDIADSYEGPCREGLANGMGTARGRDEYSGGFLDGDVHGQGVYRWGDSSKWRSEVYEGGYYRGQKYGFGIWSIDVNSDHPAKESASRVATKVGTRYYRVGLWARNTLIKSCRDISECLDSDPVLRTPLAATSRLLGAETSGLQVSDVRAALFSDLQVLGQRRHGVEACIAGEIFSLARADDTKARYLDGEQAEYIANLIGDRRLFAQILIYCAGVSSQIAPDLGGQVPRQSDWRQGPCGSDCSAEAAASKGEYDRSNPGSR